MRVCNKLHILYWLQLFAVLLLGVYLLFFGKWHVETNLLSILPNSSQHESFKSAETALFQQKTQQLVVLVTGDDALSAYKALATSINETAQVEFLPTPEPAMSDIAAFYLPYRHNVLSQNYVENIADSQALSQLASNQVIQLANPFVSETIATAPRLNLADYLQGSLLNLSDIEFYQGVAAINVQQQRYLIMHMQLSLDGFDLNASQLMAVRLKQLFSDIRDDFDVELNYSGILFHTAESTAQAKAEISSFGVFSVIAVILLIVVVFRSLLPLTAALVVLSIACLYGFVGILLFFDSLHLLTLVFAVTLVGVVVDYCFHAFVYASTQNVHLAQKDNRTIAKPLILGFITTAMGYIVLIFSPLSLLSQVAVFMIFGLFGALITVLTLLPYLDRLVNIKQAPRAMLFSQRGVTFFNKVQHYKSAIVTLLLILLSVTYFFSPIQFNDDVRLLNSSPKWLLEQEAKAAQILAYNDSQRVIIKAESPQQLLEIQEQVIARFRATQPALKVKGIYELLPSIKQQQQYYDLLADADKLGHFQSVLAITGLSDPIGTFTPLTYDEFAQSPLAFIAELYMANYKPASSVIAGSEKYALWLELSKEPLSDENLLWLEQNIHTALYDPASEVSYALSEYRQGILILLMSAFVVVMIILIVKYGLTAGTLSAIATIGSALLALTISQLISNHLNIFNLLAVLLIIALAIDYVIFYQEQGLQAKTFLAISLSALSSAAVFGILVFSATPAVSSFGLTVMIGIISIFILAPMSVVRRK